MGVSEPHPTHEMLMACRGAHRRQCAQLTTCNSHQPLLSLVAASEQGQWQRGGRRGCSAHATWCETCASNGLRRAQEHPISGSILECALSMSGRPGRLVLRLWLAHACIHAGCTLKVGLLAAWASSSSRDVTPRGFRARRCQAPVSARRAHSSLRTSHGAAPAITDFEGWSEDKSCRRHTPVLAGLGYREARALPNQRATHGPPKYLGREAR